MAFGDVSRSAKRERLTPMSRSSASPGALSRDRAKLPFSGEEPCRTATDVSSGVGSAIRTGYDRPRHRGGEATSGSDANAILLLGVPSGSTTERREDLDIARGIGIILVVYGHVMEWFFLKNSTVNHLLGGIFSPAAFRQWQYVYAFHIPLLFFVSGAANRRLPQAPLGKIVSSALGLVLIADVTHALMLIPSLASGLRHDTDLGLFLGDLVLPMLKGEDFANVVVWFLVCLAFCQLIFHGLFAEGAGKRRLLSCLALATSAICFFYLRTYNFFQVKTWLIAFAFFAAGWLFAAKRRRAVPIWIGIASLVAVAILAPLNRGCVLSFTDVCELDWVQGHFGVSLIAGRTGNLLLFYTTAALGIVGVFGVLRLFRGRLVLWCGRHSLDILIVNGVTFVAANAVPEWTALDHMALAWIVSCGIVATGSQLLVARVLETPLAMLRAATRQFAEGVTDRGRYAFGRLRWT